MGGSKIGQIAFFVPKKTVGFIGGGVKIGPKARVYVQKMGPNGVFAPKKRWFHAGKKTASQNCFFFGPTKHSFEAMKIEKLDKDDHFWSKKNMRLGGGQKLTKVLFFTNKRRFHRGGSKNWAKRAYFGHEPWPY